MHRADYCASLLPYSVGRGDQGAWARYERGEMTLLAFYEQFGRELSDRENGNVWYADYCRRKGLGAFLMTTVVVLTIPPLNATDLCVCNDDVLDDDTRRGVRVTNVHSVPRSPDEITH